ncbi:MAG: Ig-like domain-containing protein [Deltaproteobacteria bacterium]|nr:Ig-like domain-containing protein [Deltaproteobacteria bacterium]
MRNHETSTPEKRRAPALDPIERERAFAGVRARRGAREIHETMKKTCIGLLATWTVALVVVGAARAQPSGDPFLCHKTRALGARGGLPSFAARGGDVVIDVFSTARPEDRHEIDVQKAIGLCAPASVEGELVADEATHLEAYGIRVTKTSPRQPRHADSVHEIVNRFGALKLLVESEDRLLAPTAKALGTAGVEALASGGVDHFKCYDAKVARAPKGAPVYPTFAPFDVSVEDQFGPRVLAVKKPRRFCAPASVAGNDPAAPTHATYLVCYQVRLANTKPKQPKSGATTVSTHPVFGPEALAVTKPDELCVPSLKDPSAATPVPTATATPAPSGNVVAIRIAPEARYVSPGGTATYTATAELVGGGTENYTQKVVWTSSNPGVALAANATGDRSRIAAVSPGVATISATDPVSGVSSTTSGDDAAFNVPGALLGIAVTPAAVALDVGEARSLVAIGTFEGGVTRNITQQVTYGSSDPTVVVATNLDGNKSRIEAVAQGSATVTAVDPVTGVSSADGSGDATVTVLGALESLTLSPLTKTRPAGQFQSYVATGHYAGGATLNLTQEVDYASSDPGVAVAPNTPGNKGRIDTVAPGTATISASHPSGITTTLGGNDATLTVSAAVSTLIGITLAPTSATRAVGEAQNFTATGHYEGGGVANLTQQVTYVSSDPSVVAAPNALGNKSRVEMLAPGTATISATYTDPQSGLEVSTAEVGGDATVTVLGALERITLSPTQATRAVSQSLTYTAIGHFGGGATKNLTQRVDYHTSDAAIAAAPNAAGNKSRVDALAPGQVVISATDPVTGVGTTGSGDDVTLTVIGALERITLSPVVATRAPGDVQRYTATGHFGGGATQNLTQELVYSSSDPDVARAPNDPGDRSRVDTLAPGATTISATHPTTGLGSADTGDDATLTVE